MMNLRQLISFSLAMLSGLTLVNAYGVEQSPVPREAQRENIVLCRINEQNEIDVTKYYPNGHEDKVEIYPHLLEGDIVFNPKPQSDNYLSVSNTTKIDGHDYHLKYHFNDGAISVQLQQDDGRGDLYRGFGGLVDILFLPYPQNKKWWTLYVGSFEIDIMGGLFERYSHIFLTCIDYAAFLEEEV